MCGRVNVSDHEGVQQILEELGLPLRPEQFTPRYNVAPGSRLWVPVAGAGLLECTWGIVPPWARPGQFAAPLINARSETVRDKPSFRQLIVAGRAVIPVNGFYEWRRQGEDKQAFHIDGPGGQPLALAGLYQAGRDGQAQCCILTTAANRAMRRVHDRMPVILPPGSLSDWLNLEDPQQIDAFMQPASEHWLRIQAVSNYVNNARNEGPECAKPVEIEERPEAGDSDRNRAGS